mgnify:CR=1 FL=1
MTYEEFYKRTVSGFIKSRRTIEESDSTKI